MSEISNQRKLQHLNLRAGFGYSINEIGKNIKVPAEKAAEILFDNSKTFTELQTENEKEFPNVKVSGPDLNEITKVEKKKLKKQSRESIRDLNFAWYKKMSSDNAQVREKMTLFWHGHFACKTPNPVFAKNQNNMLRKNALGKFSDLLYDVSKDPAMLQFLNNQQNRKSSPNENFARELLELFTLGRGHYSEKDIKEAARAFTGWGFNKEGEFTDRKRFHDDGEKTFINVTENFDGDGIINIILDNKRTAEFITEKIYRYFVNDIVNREIVGELSKKFYESGYDTEQLMKNIFTSDWFYDKENTGIRIKSPAEFICGLIRTFGVEFKNPLSLIAIQKVLGQMLFNPPNVAGWTGGRSWIDSSSLMYRMKIPEMIFKSSDVEIDYKENPAESKNADMQTLKKEKKQIRNLNAKADLKSFVYSFRKYDEEELPDKLCEYLLQTDINIEKRKIILKYADKSSKENFIESLTLRIITLPEYQLC